MPNAELPSLTLLESRVRLPVRTRRMLEGKEEEVGVAGRTLMELWGDLVSLWPEMDTAGEVMDIEDVEEALEWVWWWWGIERMDETEEDVDFLPRRPPLDRR